ncbi:astacin, partial [Cooperia oncophora]
IGFVVHEIGHALGFYHTHQRYDRHKYVQYYKHNLNRTLRSQYKKVNKTVSNNHGVAYDPGSVMHYRAYGGSINKNHTLAPHDPLYKETLGSHRLSFYDVKLMNKYYACDSRNGGYPHPRNCSECLCPRGYGGQTCEEKPERCGARLQANNTWQLLNDTLDGRIASQELDGYEECVYWIKVCTRGEVVEVQIVELPENATVGGCVYAGVEIKAQVDQALTGYRFCSEGAININITSQVETVPVITYNGRNRTATTRLRYRSVPNVTVTSESDTTASQS